MICQVIRNKETNEIDRILAPNGKDSILYKNLLDITKNKEDAFKLWTKVYTSTFKSWFGDWLNKPQSVKNIDDNGEPKLINNSYINFKNQNYPVINSIGKSDNVQFQKLTAEEKAKTIEQVTKEHRSIAALIDLAAKLGIIITD